MLIKFPNQSVVQKNITIPALYYNEIWSFDKMAAYLGVDLSVIGDGLTYSGNSNFTVTLANDGTVAYDTAGYCYNKSDVLILVSKIGTPYDCMYQLDSNEKPPLS